MSMEGEQLAKRITGINTFRTTEAFGQLDPIDQHLLVLQCEAMQMYLHVLTLRFSAAQDIAKAPGSAIIRPQ